MLKRVFPVFLMMVALLVTGAAAETADSAAGVVNINTAKAEQLQLLPRIGPALSERIISFREANGVFESTDELVAVKGIGDKSYESLKPYVTVKGETTHSEKVSLRRTKASTDQS